MRHLLWQKLPTYVWEMGFAAVYLAAVTILVSDGQEIREIVGQVLSSIAVLLSFGHMQVSSRLEEQQEVLQVKSVECYALLTRYLIGKEVAWIAAFACLGAWSALAGVPLFLLYPAWRRWYRSPQRK